MSEATNGSGEKPTTAIATMQQSAAAQEYELMLRQAKLYASSPLVPQHMRGANINEGIANCYIAMALAKQMNEAEIVVMQSIYIVHGKAGWAATYMIAKANASGVFRGVLRFKHTGVGKDRACTCSGVLKDTGETVEAVVTMAMAEAEGWTKNPKYRTMPDLMLTYRSATFLVRMYCPHVMLGYHTAEELEDVSASMGADEDVQTNPKSVVETLKARVAATAPTVVDAVPDAVIEPPVVAAAPADDKLLELFVEYEAAGGIPEEWAESQGLTVKAVKASRNKARSEYCTKLHAEIAALKAAKS